MCLSAAAAALRACASGSAGPVILACSGGADSTFLAAAWAQTSGLPPAVAVIVDHGHRAGSAADAEKARALLKFLGLRAEVVRADPPAPPGANEDSLREVRYTALTAAARRHAAAKILTAHTADDLAETVLLRIFRGTGLRGLAGIPTRRELAPGIELLRPFLALRRAALRAALAARGIAWVADPTNADPASNARARLRLHVLPALATIATGDPVQAVLRLAGEARAWSESLDILLTNAPDWRALPPYLREQAVAAQLRALGETVSPARLRDLTSALDSRGSAGVGQGRVLCMSREGGLSCRGGEHAEE
jgi:tRNA(Ile)-lysidine synthase